MVAAEKTLDTMRLLMSLQ